MPNLSNLTLAQLRAATSAQIVTAITNKLNTLTKRQLIEFLLDVVDFPDNPVCTYRADGQIASETVIARDALGAKTGTRVITWTYFDKLPRTPVSVITVRELNTADAETSKRSIQHFADGSQPIATLVIAKPLALVVAEEIPAPPFSEATSSVEETVMTPIPPVELPTRWLAEELQIAPSPARAFAIVWFMRASLAVLAIAAAASGVLWLLGTH